MDAVSPRVACVLVGIDRIAFWQQQREVFAHLSSSTFQLD
jgi:hypothetical protein